MSKTITVNSIVALHHALRQISDEWDDHRYLEIEIKQKAGQRTLTQNRSLHLFCRMLADGLNAAGLDMRKVLRQDVDIPWTTETVKNQLWRPIQKALTDKQSTTEITTVEPTAIHQVLSRHLGEKLGVTCPAWPTREREAA